MLVIRRWSHFKLTQLTLINYAQNEPGNHGSNQTSYGIDAPKVKEDHLVVSAMEVHLHAHIHHHAAQILLPEMKQLNSSRQLKFVCSLKEER